MSALKTLLSIAEAVMPNRRFVLIACTVDEDGLATVESVANIMQPAVQSICLLVASGKGEIHTREALDEQQIN